MSAVDFDIYADDFRNDPYPFYARLRDEAPVQWSERHGFWTIAQYADVMAAAKNYNDFSSTIAPTGGIETGERRQTMISSDPPEHTRIRSVVGRAFTPATIAAMESRIRQIAVDLIEEMRDKARSGEEIDFVESFSSPLPVLVIAEILGVPADMRARLRQWQVTLSDAGPTMGDSDKQTAREKIRHEMRGYFEELGEERRLDPQNDLISDIFRAAELEDLELSSYDLAILCSLLWNAGNETTTNLLNNGMAAARQNPEEYRKVKDDRSLVPSFVEEALRYDAPVAGLFRRAKRDFDFRGQPIKEGQPLWLLYGSANRDAGQFKDADRFMVERHPNRHVAFGFGIHFCIGAPLARLEGRVGMEELLDRVPDLRVYPERGERKSTQVIRGFNRLPASLSVTSAA